MLESLDMGSGYYTCTTVPSLATFSILHCDKLRLDNKHGNNVINNNDTYMYLQYISTIVRYRSRTTLHSLVLVGLLEA